MTEELVRAGKERQFWSVQEEKAGERVQAGVEGALVRRTVREEVKVRRAVARMWGKGKIRQGIEAVARVRLWKDIRCLVERWKMTVKVIQAVARMWKAKAWRLFLYRREYEGMVDAYMRWRYRI